MYFRDFAKKKACTNPALNPTNAIITYLGDDLAGKRIGKDVVKTLPVELKKTEHC
jgi:hypothetical protein